MFHGGRTGAGMMCLDEIYSKEKEDLPKSVVGYCAVWKHSDGTCFSLFGFEYGCGPVMYRVGEMKKPSDNFTKTIRF